MLKKYCIWAVLVAFGLWDLRIDDMISFVLANIAPRNQADQFMRWWNDTWLSSYFPRVWLMLWRGKMYLFLHARFIYSLSLPSSIPVSVQERSMSVQNKQNTQHLGGSRFTTDQYRCFHYEIRVFGCGWSWVYSGFLLPSIWVAMLCPLIDQHDSVHFGFCLFLFCLPYPQHCDPFPV